MPTEKAEKKIDRLTTGYNGINAISSRLTAATKGGSTQAALAETMKSDLTDAENQKKADNKALKSAKTANKKASSAKKKADNKVKSTAKSLLKTNLTDEQKRQVQAGKKIDSTGMSGSQKKKADAYNKAVTNKSKANKKATSAKSKLSTAKSNYNSSNSTYNSMKSNVNEALTVYDSGDSLSYMNSLVDQQVSGKKLEQDARKTAVEQANANLTTTKKQKTTANKKLAKLQKKYKNSKNLTAINDAVKNTGLSTASTINAISSILRHYGLSDSEISQSGLTDIKGYASGTNYVNKSGIYRVNENGMESVFSKQYGTLTFLNQGDKVFDANFTKSLLDNATIATQKNMPDYAGMAKAIEKNIQNIQNLSGNTYVNNFYIDGAQDTESILREIDKHLDKKIQAHDKKQVRDFKSLR